MSERLIQQLRVHEGVEPFGYFCTSMKLTVGVGRCIDKDGGIGLSDCLLYTSDSADDS